jgi:hypothetical protein
MLRNVILFLAIFTLCVSIAPLFEHQGTASAQDWPNFWQRLKGHTQLVLDYTTDNGQTWIDVSPLAHITYTDKIEPHKKKFGLDFTAPVTAKYRLRVVVKYPLVHNCTINKDTHIISIYYGNYTVRLDYSDIAAVSTINIGYDDEYYFGFKITSKNNIPAGFNVDLDPEYVAVDSSSPDFPYDTLHWQNSRHLTRISNGTMFLIYCGGEYMSNEYLNISRSFNNGTSWNHWKILTNASGGGNPVMYCPNIISDGYDSLHIAWQQGPGAAYKTQYCRYNTSTDTWMHQQPSHGLNISGTNAYQPTLDIDGNNTLVCAWYTTVSPTNYTAEYSTSTNFGKTWSAPAEISQKVDYGTKRSVGMWGVLSTGDKVYAVTGQRPGGGTYSIRLRWYYASNSSWSKNTFNVSEPLGIADNHGWPGVATDNLDNLHVSWFDWDTNEIYYRMWNGTNHTWAGVVNLGPGAAPSLSIDNASNVYVVYQNTNLAFSEMYCNYINYRIGHESVFAAAIKASRDVEATINDPCALYNRFPIVGGAPVNRPLRGLVFIYYNDTGPPGERIYIKLENVTWFSSVGITLKPENVNTTRATLRGRIINDTLTGGVSASFFVKAGAIPTTTSYDFNFSAGSGYNMGTPNIWCNATGLLPGKYYYVRLWTKDGTTKSLYNTSYMLTQPSNATSLTIVNITTSAHLKWTNPTITNGSLYAICRWSIVGFPGTIFAGNAGFNVTTTSGTFGHRNVTGLTAGTHIYFSVFSYMYSAGSPLLHSTSWSFAGTTGNSSSGVSVIACNNTNVNTTRATLHARVVNATVGTFTAGFYVQYGGVPSQISFQYNFTAGTDFNLVSKPNIWYNATGLSNAFDYNYYYVRPWTRINTFKLSNWSYMLMKPYNITSASIYNTQGRKIELQWITPIQPIGTLNTICRYSDTGYPGTPFAGTGGFNITTLPSSSYRYNITGLNPGTKYYISLFSYVVASGSPTLHSYSSSYVGIVGNTSGGIYNITFKHENQSSLLSNKLDRVFRTGARKTGPCMLVVYYPNKTEYNYFSYIYLGIGWNYTQSQGDFNHTFKQYVLLYLTQTPMRIEFWWNCTNNATDGGWANATEYSCIRSLIPVAGQKNLTFYVSTNRLVYGKSTAAWNYSIIRYTLSISDFSSYFLSEGGLSSYIYIYDYDNESNKRVIDMQYVDSYNRVYSMLWYGKSYYWGIGNANLILSQVGIVPTFEMTTLGTLVVRYSQTPYNLQFNLTTGRINPLHNGLWFNYNIGGSITSAVDIKIFDTINLTQVYGSSSGLSTFNFTWAGGLANRTYYYIFRHNGTSSIYDFETSWYIFNTNQSFRWNGSRLESFIVKIFGPTPFINSNTGKSVDYLPVIVIFGVFVGLCFSGIKMESNLLIAASGLWDIFAGGLFGTTLAIPAIGLGIFCLIIAFIYKRPEV